MRVSADVSIAEVVQASVDAWNTSLVASGCDVAFEVVPVGGDVHISAPDVWRHGSAAGVWLAGVSRIEVRIATQPIIAHELGHALGLIHTETAPSLMTRIPSSDRPEPADLIELDCGGL